MCLSIDSNLAELSWYSRSLSCKVGHTAPLHVRVCLGGASYTRFLSRFLPFCCCCFLIYFYEFCMFWISLSYMSFANITSQISSYLIYVWILWDRVLQYSRAGLQLAILLPQAFDAGITGVIVSCCLLIVLFILIRCSLLVFLSWNILLLKSPAGCGVSHLESQHLRWRGRGLWIQSYVRLHETLS